MTANVLHTAPRFAQIEWRARQVSLEYQWVGAESSAHPVLVFLHEGLGSLALWKNFPDQFCRAAGLRGLVFSRYGYGQSTLRPADERWPVDFMHQQAYEVLPRFLASVGVEKPWLFGHSDGGSIALLYASRCSRQLSGIVVVAPHITVEDVNIANIRVARNAYLTTDLRAKLARYQVDVDSVFWGWNEIWLDPAFRSWSIEAELAAITCPVLAVQGEDDEYGSLQQVFGIREKIPGAKIVVLKQCGHSPHRDQPKALSEAAANFITNTV